MRILVAHWRDLEPNTNAGDLRLFDMIRLLVELGHEVDFMPHTHEAIGVADQILSRLGVRSSMAIDDAILRCPNRFAWYLLRRNFDCAILSHYTSAARLLPTLRQVLPSCATVLDTIDLSFLRLQRAAELSGREADRRECTRVSGEEWAAMRAADSVWVVTRDEAHRIQPEIGCVGIIPTIHRVQADRPAFGQRRGVVFLGGYHHRPNVDAVQYFMRDIFPLVKTRASDIPVFIAGSNPPPEFEAYAAHDPNVQVTGFVEDHRKLLMQCRVGMAPLRYGAGIRGKIGEYLACGLPCVTTGIGAEGMGLRHGIEVMVADAPDAFAARIVELHADEEAWGRLSAAGAAYIERTFSPDHVRDLLDPALLAAVAEHRRRRRAGLLQRGTRLRSMLKLAADKLRR